ncbi:TetR/AcrR family transcriptional regulator [Microbacterium lushaniae]|uniref:TetR/AcrR family transcriptional regulator n=1 Tax=Microbacterium lushaniae TaxID=2614639 RepID=A0A5J6L3L6_9MICO|nr:TetR family transcriptional regulator [Microbacterium lushaniae]QEW02932.1 TetR/AcrR family transcriptional regulator [Microbacterium lushaniae]
MARPGDRRPLITDHAIAVLAKGGARALSHQAVDRAAGLATGSTSYYFRTRHDLVVATIGRIREHSRAAFDESPVSVTITPRTAAALMADQLLLLAGPRRDDALAVFSLVAEVEGDPELRAQLAGCLFSRELAAKLLVALGGSDADGAALDLIDFLTGILFGLLFGQRRTEDADGTRIADALQRFLMINVDAAGS